MTKRTRIPNPNALRSQKPPLSSPPNTRPDFALRAQTTRNPTLGNPGNLAHDPASPVVYSSNQLPKGIGYGPADISLRPLFPQPWSGVNPNGTPTGFSVGNRSEITAQTSGTPIDDYATVLAG